MKISIAMATYNGARFLQAQLASFASQSRLPDELIVCDDMSKDETLDILLSFAVSAPFKVEVVQNECNLGFVKNFEKAISLCTGDITFLSDQDDVWFSRKLKTIEDMFISNTGILVALNDQEITDEFLNASGKTIFSNSRALGFYTSCPGCCTAFRLEFKNLLLPFPTDLATHDGLIHRLALGLDVLKIVPEVLQYYRRHSNNESSAMATSIRNTNKLTPIFRYGLKDATVGWRNEISLSNHLVVLTNNRLDYLQKLGLNNQAALINKLEKKRVEALEKRIILLKSGRFKRFFRALGFYRYGGYDLFSGWRSLAKDLIRTRSRDVNT